MDHAVAVILAGGSGTRFWPMSTKKEPKQLCHVGGMDQTMLELTLQRLDGWIPAEKRIIITNSDLVEPTKNICGAKVAHVISEPVGKNTANALLLGARVARKLDPEAVMLSFHADHLIREEDLFRSCCKMAYNVAEEKKTVLMGIKPRHPETGYGYIEIADKHKSENSLDAFQVTSFKEKPDIATAREYVISGCYLWNSGLFSWKASYFEELFEKYIPKNADKMKSVSADDIIAGNFVSEFSELESISVDHGILEKTDGIIAIACPFEWYDVGSWSAIRECFAVNETESYEEGQVINLDSESVTLVNRSDKIMAAVGLKDVAVVATDRAILVCSHDQAQKVSQLVKLMKEQKLDDYL